jgi:hypothetical protein
VFLPIEIRKDKLPREEVERRAVARSHEFLNCEVEMQPQAVTARAVMSPSTGRARLSHVQVNPPAKAVAPTPESQGNA